MALTKEEVERQERQARKLELYRLVEENDAKVGIPRGPAPITPPELQRRMIERGVKPEDNIGSRELMRMRYGDDWEAEE